MQEWIKAAQRLIDWIDEHAAENPSLSEISQQIGYSPYYCSVQFHRICGMTIRDYTAKRRLAMAALALRDTDTPIVEIALEYGFSSQTALTRAFRAAYRISPSGYRKHPTPIPILCRKVVLTPFLINRNGDVDMSHLSIPTVRVEYIPAHKYLGVYRRSETKDGPIWPGHDCDLLTGIVTSLPETDRIVTAHTAGWVNRNGKRSYFYGAGIASEQTGITIPEGFELRGEFPDSYYLVFSHPPFAYLEDNDEVMRRVEETAWNFDPTEMGFAWNEEECQCYQRHYPEGLGYQVLRPVKKL